jgi:putative heme iron utilization protein
MLLSELAEHTKNLLARPEASLLVADPGAKDPLAAPRMTLLGHVAQVPDADRDDATRAFLATHPSAAAYASFKDFRLYRVELVAVRYVLGFGRMAWIDPADLRG